MFTTTRSMLRYWLVLEETNLKREETRNHNKRKFYLFCQEDEGELCADNEGDGGDRESYGQGDGGNRESCMFNNLTLAC